MEQFDENRVYKEGYKQFDRDKSGDLHPLFVNTKLVIPTGVWLRAEEGPQNENGKVISKLGPLSYRPGWHLSEAPYAPHIGIKENGKVKYMKPNTVWTRCKIYDEIDYTFQAERNGWKNGKFSAQRACLHTIPKYGYYEYNTNPNAYGTWYIAEWIMVEEILSDEQVENICWYEFGIHAQPRKVG